MARILVVDDERNLRVALTLTLRREGYEVDAAGDGAEAIRRAAEQPYDLVLTDVRMPEMDGYELLATLKEKSPETDVILVTAHGTIEGAVEAMQMGAHNYLRKPFEPHELTTLVRDTLARRQTTPQATGTEALTQRIPHHRKIIGNSLAILELLDLVGKVAGTESTVLITGETGTGKELVGQAIHESSQRRTRVFCAVNSAAFPETLLESELFGHRRGSFTGASTNKKGLFEQAHRGSVFLDEVAEMPLSMQAKLLRFLQTGEIRPVGSETTRYVDVRLITATNKDLEAEVGAGRFREDLYYRLAVIPIHVPPLRERREDIPVLAEHFLHRFSHRLNKPVESIDSQALDAMLAYSWPGNVRELENSIERGVALCRGASLSEKDLPARLREPSVISQGENLQSLHMLERAHILKTLDRVGWNRKRAAEILKISTTTLWRRLKEFGVEAPGANASRW